MKRFLGLLILALALMVMRVAPAGATACTVGTMCGISVTTASNEILIGGDVQGGRHYLFLANIGGVGAYCTIAAGGAGAATATATNGFYLAANGGQYMPSPPQWTESQPGLVPGGDVACITASGTTTIVGYDY